MSTNWEVLAMVWWENVGVLVVVDGAISLIQWGRAKRLRGNCPGRVSMPRPPPRRVLDTDGFLGFERAASSCSMLRKVNGPFVCCIPTQRPHSSRPRHSGNTHAPLVGSGMVLETAGFKGTELRGGTKKGGAALVLTDSLMPTLEAGMGAILRSICDPVPALRKTSR